MHEIDNVTNFLLFFFFFFFLYKLANIENTLQKPVLVFFSTYTTQNKSSIVFLYLDREERSPVYIQAYRQTHTHTHTQRDIQTNKHT